MASRLFVVLQSTTLCVWTRDVTCVSTRMFVCRFQPSMRRSSTACLKKTSFIDINNPTVLIYRNNIGPDQIKGVSWYLCAAQSQPQRPFQPKPPLLGLLSSLVSIQTLLIDETTSSQLISSLISMLFGLASLALAC